MKRHLLAILLAMLLISCEDVWNGMCGGDYLVNLYNKSADTVFVLTMMGKDTIPLDTTAYTKFWIAENTKSSVFAVDKPLDKLCDPIQIFVIDNDTMRKNDLSLILERYNIICRYDLSGSDIVALNYTIPYPPSPAMKDMSMYPPYEEIIKQEE